MSHPFDTLTPDLVLDAVESIGYLSDARVLALNSYENRVYQVGIEDETPLIAKFYRPGRWSDAAILEEHQFSLELAEHEVPVVFAEHGKYPAIADVASDFVYARLQKGNDELKTCYPPKQLDAWAKRFQDWAAGGEPDDLPKVDKSAPKKAPRDVFAYVIHEGKIRAPAGAMELIERVK